MAVSVKTVSPATVPGNARMAMVEVTCDSSYQENGEPLTWKEIGLTYITSTQCSVLNGSEAEANPVGWAKYNVSKELLEVFNSKTNKQIASGVDLSKCVIQVLARGY